MNEHELFEDDYHHYAYNDKGELVHLSIDKEPIQREKYKCIACEHEMRPVMGKNKIRDWHFRHTVANPECNTESYLHQLAKKLIKEKFDNNEEFIISYYVKEVCSYYNKCKKHFDYCERNLLKTINLKEIYDTCIPEKKDSHLKINLTTLNTPKKKSDINRKMNKLTHKKFMKFIYTKYNIKYYFSSWILILRLSS